MKSFTDCVNKISRTPVLVAAGIVFAGFIAFVLPHQKEMTEPFTGKAGSPGLSFYPTPDRVYEMAESYGEAGRSVYTKTLLTYDLAWPLVYSLFFLICINRTLGYVHGGKGSRLCAVALLPLLLDVGENILAVIIMTAYPATLYSAARVMAAMTCLKWVTMGAATCLLAYGLIGLPIRFFYTSTCKPHP